MRSRRQSTRQFNLNDEIWKVYIGNKAQREKFREDIQGFEDATEEYGSCEDSQNSLDHEHESDLDQRSQIPVS